MRIMQINYSVLDMSFEKRLPGLCRGNASLTRYWGSFMGRVCILVIRENSCSLRYQAILEHPKRCRYNGTEVTVFCSYEDVYC
jgi:hypothetical protein